MAAPLAIFTADSNEAALVRRLFQVQQSVATPVGPLWQGTRHGQAVLILQSGPGPARAAQAAAWLCRDRALAGVLSVGFAGGLRADLATGDALLCTRLLAQGLEAVTLQPDARLSHLAAMAVAQAGVVSHAGPLLTVRTLLTQATRKEVIGRLSGAMAVDMESHSIGQQAVEHGVPFAVLRTIFDTAREDFTLPVSEWTTVEGNIQHGRLALSVLTRPWLYYRLPHWGWAAFVAGRHLQRWLRHFFLLLQQGA